MKKQALLIGINEYPILPKLNFARQDAESVADSLKQNYCFSDDEVMLLTDAKPGLLKPINRYIIQDHLEKLANQDLDLFIFGFWGHGLFRNDKRYLCPLDVMAKRAESQGLPFDELQDLLINIKAKNTCLILDCCQKVHDRGESETLTASDKASMENVARNIFLKRKEQIPNFQSNVAILNSCKEGQSAYEWDARQHGLFTAYLLDAMKMHSKSILQIAAYISNNIEKTALELGKEQTPFYKIEGDIQLPVDTSFAPESVTPVHNTKPSFNPRNVVVPDDFATIEEAYDNVIDGGIITIKSGKYELSATLAVNRPVTFRGISGKAEEVVINCPVSDTFRITDDSPSFQYLTISSGAEKCNGMFVTGGSPRLIRCAITSSKGSGMTVKGRNADPQVESCSIKDCGGAGVCVEEYGVGSFNDCEIYANANEGIVVKTSGNPIVTKCKIHDMKEQGVWVPENGLGKFSDCEIYHNTFSGIKIQTSGNPTFIRCKIHGGQKSGVFVYENGLGTFTNCDIYENATSGVQIQTLSDPTFTSCKIHDGKSNGVVSYKNALGKFIDCEIYGDMLPEIGIGMSSNPTFTRCKIHDGKSNGVAVDNNGLGSFCDCEIYGNALPGFYINSQGNPTVTRCKIHDGKGSGVYVLKNGLGKFSDCDIYKNNKSGIVVDTSGDPTFTDCKIHNGDIGVAVSLNGLGSFNNCEIYENVKPGIVVTESGNPTVIGCKIHDGKDCGVLILKNGMGTFNNNKLERNNVIDPQVKELLNWIGQGQRNEPIDWDIRSDAGVVKGSGNTPPLPKR